MEFVRHIQSNNGDYYHRIIMRIIQSSYSSLLAKYTLTILQKTDMSFHDIHKGAIKLPNYVNTVGGYKIFEITK